MSNTNLTFNGMAKFIYRLDIPKDIGINIGGWGYEDTEYTTSLLPGRTEDELKDHIVGHFARLEIEPLDDCTDKDDVIRSANDLLRERFTRLVDDIRELNLRYTAEIPLGGRVITIDIRIETDLAVVSRTIENELSDSYLDYAMSVIVGRALPDVRDGLKPVHRRVLFAMEQLGNQYNKGYKKSARVVGDVIGKYHPHGDSAVYDSIVRMAQDFSLRYPLVDGQGNFGSVDGDSAAAMRYTEVRMDRIASELLGDLNYDTVDFVDNYDGTERVPEVLPATIPNLLVNGATGIAVGMATNIPPHNLSEVVGAAIELLDHPDTDVDGLMQFITAPDFPTGATIVGRAGIRQAYSTGRGKIYLRAVVDYEKTATATDGIKSHSLIVTEIPYQINKARLIERIAELVKDRRIEGITNLRDESNKDGMRIVISLRRDAIPEVVKNNLYQLTSMQTTFGINMVALDRGVPKLFTLKHLLDAFLNHRREVVTRRTICQLNGAESKNHVIEGRIVAHSNIDDLVKIITKSRNRASAREAIAERTWTLPATLRNQLLVDGQEPVVIDEEVKLSPEQVDAILSMTLSALVGMELNNLVLESQAILVDIGEYRQILECPDKLQTVIRDELSSIESRYGDDRLTTVEDGDTDLLTEDMIPQSDVIVTLSDSGYVKYQTMEEYQPQRRGGRGKSGVKMKEDDFISRMVYTNSHDTLLCFSSLGRVYWKRTFELPKASRTGRGKPIINILPLSADETITAILPVSDFNVSKYVFMATAHGTVKKVALDNFAKPRSTGIIAMNLLEDDELIGVELTDGDNDILLFSNAGRVCRFHEGQVRPMGRAACGVRGMKLANNASVISMVVPNGDGDILTATECGLGKRTPLKLYPCKSRANAGVVSIKISERGGAVVGAIQVDIDDTYMAITDQGMVVRCAVSEVCQFGRNTIGVNLMRLEMEDNRIVEHIVAIQRIDGDVTVDDVDEVRPSVLNATLE